MGKLSLASPSQPTNFSLDPALAPLMGAHGIWGSSLVLEGPARERICAALIPQADSGHLKLAEAIFTSPVAGKVFLQTLSLGERIETKIFTNLYHVVSAGGSSTHKWQIFITDVIGSNRRRQSCNFLNIKYDPENKPDESCSKDNPSGCKDGDLEGKFGSVKVGKQESMFSKKYYMDPSLSLPNLRGSRMLYLVLYDADHTDSFLACAQINMIKPKVAKVTFMNDGVSGEISFKQDSAFHPVFVTETLSGLHDGAGSFHIHEFPVPPRMFLDDAVCGQTGGHFNPYNKDKSSSPPPGEGSSDQYEVGDLSGKYGDLKLKERVNGSFVDPSLSLYGARSIIGRSVVIHKSPKPERWVCANIEEDVAKITAVATFTYPVAGKIMFRQEADRPLADTSIYVEGLVYSDGTKNNTGGHKWHVHREIPGKDFFNCLGKQSQRQRILLILPDVCL